MSEIKKIAKELKKAILSDNKKSALSLFQQGLRGDEEKFVAQLRSNGVMRCSNYSFKSNILNTLVQEAQSQRINISSNRKKYFKSVHSLLVISRDIQSIFKDLLKEVNTKEMKSYLVAIDSLFWLLLDPQERYHLGKSFPREELASAFSLYFYHNHHSGIIEKIKLDKVNEKYLKQKYYVKKLEKFSNILFFKECELLVDHFGYTVTQNNKKFTVKPPTERIEMSICLGYILESTANIATSIDSLLESKEYNESMCNFVTNYYDQHKDFTFGVKDYPLKRIVMQLPMVEPLKECLRSKSIFLEETMFISNIEKNFFITFKEINEITVYKNLSLFDIIQMQRLFTFMFLLFWEYIEDNGLKGTDLFWRSILPVFELGAFKDFLAQFFSQEKVNSFFELFAWSPEKNKFFDLQTYPFIMLNEWVILPLGILSNSNLCRNILQATGFRFDSESSQDPIVFAMERCLKEVSSIFRSNLKYSFQGIDGEIDVLAVIDDYIFIFECKNSLHPCSPFELRTTYDYIKKAAKQLSDFQKLWQEELFRDYIAHKIKSQKLPSKLSLCIVTGNRMFPGWREEGYSVRSVHELLNFINSGEFRIHSYDSSAIDENRKTTIFKLWKQTNFNSKDLFKYIEEDFIHKYYFESMIKRETKIQFKDKILTKESYGLDMNKLLKQFIDNFKIVEES